MAESSCVFGNEVLTCKTAPQNDQQTQTDRYNGPHFQPDENCTEAG